MHNNTDDGSDRFVGAGLHPTGSSISLDLLPPFHSWLLGTWKSNAIATSSGAKGRSLRRCLDLPHFSQKYSVISQPLMSGWMMRGSQVPRSDCGGS